MHGIFDANLLFIMIAKIEDSPMAAMAVETCRERLPHHRSQRVRQAYFA